MAADNKLTADKAALPRLLKIPPAASVAGPGGANVRSL
jgi:hypothetical protein